MRAGSTRNLDALQEEVTGNPRDPEKARAFLDAFEREPVRHGERYVAYLQTRYYHDVRKHEHLNGIGDCFSESNRPYLSALCYLESLRLEPAQPEILSKLEEVEPHLAPPRLPESAADQVLVSIIMGTFDRGDEMFESIESVLRQTVQNFELIVVNDGGDPRLEGRLRSFGSDKIGYVRLPENRGHAAALNEGIRRSRGKYIAYLDDDDVYYPDHLERLLRQLANEGCRFAYSNTKMVAGALRNGRFSEEGVKGHWRLEFQRDKLLESNYIANLSVVHERSIFREIGLFHEDLRVVMDWELWLRAALRYEFFHLDADTGEYRFRKGNVTGTKRLPIEFNTDMIRNYYAYYRGGVAYFKHFSRANRKDTARRHYESVKAQYDSYFKSPASAVDLIGMAEMYGDSGFAGRVAKDLFRRDTRSLVKEIRAGRYRLLVPVLPLVPGKMLDFVKCRIR